MLSHAYRAQYQLPGAYGFALSPKQLTQVCEQTVKQKQKEYETLQKQAATVATAIDADFKNFQNSLITGARHYINLHKPNFFRNTGKERARVLIKNIQEAKNPLAALSALKKVNASSSNYAHDSLRTILQKNLETIYPLIKTILKYNTLSDFTEVLMEQYQSRVDILRAQQDDQSPEHDSTSIPLHDLRGGRK